jgi:RsiW-degrading membrane proteinase PrsW (M82 family)
MENIKDAEVMVAVDEKLQRSRKWWRKIVIGAIIAVGAAIVLFSCYLMATGRAELEGMMTIIIVTVFGLIFSFSLMDRLGV